MSYLSTGSISQVQFRPTPDARRGGRAGGKRCFQRQKFVLAVLTLTEDAPISPDKPKRRVKWPYVEARARRIFGDRIMPNLISLGARRSCVLKGMNHYADSSFLVSCYVVDANTSQAKSWLSKAGVPLPFTALHSLEVRNAFKLGVFRGLFSAADAAAAWSNLEKDLRSGRLTKTAANGRWRCASPQP